MAGAAERPVVFECRGERLVGMLHDVSGDARAGVVIVVGGPQYRVGSHRQFVLLARALAAAGLPCLRFDYRGMGDSDGEFTGFETIDDDVRAAIDAFIDHCPGLERIFLWGLCDAASAILFYAHTDPRVAGIALINPWVRTEEGIARAYFRHYYTARFLDPAFWRKVGRGEFRAGDSLRAMMRLARSAAGSGADGALPDAVTANGVTTADREKLAGDDRPLPNRMAEGLSRFDGPVLLVISGNDLTAREFEDAANASKRWKTLLAEDRVTRHRLEPADHTFSRRAWRDRLAEWTVGWVRSSPEAD